MSFFRCAGGTSWKSKDIALTDTFTRPTTTATATCTFTHDAGVKVLDAVVLSGFTSSSGRFAGPSFSVTHSGTTFSVIIKATLENAYSSTLTYTVRVYYK